MDLESINATNMNCNAEAIARRKAAVIFIQEHRLKGNTIRKVADILKDSKWTLKCGPCDESATTTECGSWSDDQ